MLDRPKISNFLFSPFAPLFIFKHKNTQKPSPVHYFHHLIIIQVTWNVNNIIKQSRLDKPTNQKINKSINQSINQSTNQQINQSINQSTNKMEATGTNLTTLDLPSTTLAERQAHADLLLSLEAKRIASTIDVPTLPNDIRNALREIGQPVRLFGENKANVRDRLRMCLAKIQVQGTGAVGDASAVGIGVGIGEGMGMGMGESKQSKESSMGVQYTHASQELIQTRSFLSDYSIQRAQERLHRERKRRRGGHLRIHNKDNGNDNANDPATVEILNEVDELDTTCQKRYDRIQKVALEGSQYGDGRPLSAIATCRQYNYNGKDQGQSKGKVNKDTDTDTDAHPCLIVTGGWTGSIKLWDGSTPALNLMATKLMAHEDRVTSVAMHHGVGNDSGNSNGGIRDLASASIDLTAKLWKVNQNNDTPMETDEHTDRSNSNSNSNSNSSNQYNIQEMATLKGHAARLCKIAYHPSGRYVGTTSFDHTWRLWDVETGGTELLLQDGHWKEVYGINFHPDGSLVTTTDFGSVVQMWDLRSGKSCAHFLGHAGRVLCSEFSPNGFQCASAGDDGTIKIWDMRQRKLYASIPAHSRLITQIKFAHGYEGYGQNGEFLTSCSFDGTAKVWSTRNWKLLSTLRGHEGKVMGVDILDGVDAGIVTCGYDKTMKIWR
jgi:U4/U6 small nuclear ribonucleoprotein PRP4